MNFTKKLIQELVEKITREPVKTIVPFNASIRGVLSSNMHDWLSEFLSDASDSSTYKRQIFFGDVSLIFSPDGITGSDAIEISFHGHGATSGAMVEIFRIIQTSSNLYYNPIYLQNQLIQGFDFIDAFAAGNFRIHLQFNGYLLTY